jgi:hypothetical protein
MGDPALPQLLRMQRGIQGDPSIAGVLQDDAVIQQEYQTRLRHHDIKIRPEIIVHTPFERGGMKNRDQGNSVAIELKRKATAFDVARDRFSK